MEDPFVSVRSRARWSGPSSIPSVRRSSSWAAIELRVPKGGRRLQRWEIA